MSPSRNPPQKWFGFKGGRPRRRVLHVGTNSLEARGGSWTSRLCSSLTNPNCHILTETYGITSSKPYPHSQNVVPLYLRAMVAQLRESIWLALRFSLWIARGLPSALRRVMMTYHLLAEQNLMSWSKICIQETTLTSLFLRVPWSLLGATSELFAIF